MNIEPQSSRRLDAMLDALPREAEPSRDLWPAIATRIADGAHPVGRRAGRRGVRAIAWIATALAASVVGVVVFGTVGSPLPSQQKARLADAGPGSATREARFRSVRDELEMRYKERLLLLSPTVRARVEADLEVIRSAQADLEKALESDPANRVLMDLYTNTTHQEVELYSAITRATEPVSTRNRT